jgi:hypothetical protein
MAESGLSIGFTDLKQAVGRLLGFGTTVNNWSAARTTIIEDLVQNGVRRVYYPGAIPARQDLAGYDWSFLRPYATLSLVASDWDYDCPDNFGRLIGPIHYAADEYRDPIVQVSAGMILDRRSQYNETGYAEICATRYKTEDRTAGSRQELIVYPTPDANKTCSYQYEAYSGPLSDSYPYPLGGMQLAELFIESCLAATELYMRDENGIHNQQFQVLLIDAIMRDRNRGARQFGHMGSGEAEGSYFPFRRGYGSSTYSLTYKGSPI